MSQAPQAQRDQPEPQEKLEQQEYLVQREVREQPELQELLVLLDQQGHPERLVPPVEPEQLVFRVVLELQVVWDPPDPRDQQEQPEPQVFKVARELQALLE